MPRSLNADTITAISGISFKMCHLVKISLDSLVYLTNNPYPVSFGGQTYIASRHFISSQDVSEGQQLRVNKMAVQLSSVGKEFVPIMLEDRYINRRLEIWLAAINESGSIIGEPIKMFDGLIESFTLAEDDATSRIQLNAASHWADFERIQGRLTNNNSQQFYFPDDTGMRFAAETIKDIKWGRA